MNVRAAGAPTVSIFAGVSVTAVSLGSMLLPAQHQRAGVADVPCMDTSPGAVSSTPTPSSTPSGGAYELCLSVAQSPAARATPGSDLTYSIKVWVVSLGPAGSSAPTANIHATVTLQANRGSGALHWALCPSSEDYLACGPLPLQPGAAGNSLQADLAIPDGASAGQTIGFKVNATDPDAGATNVQPAGEVDETVTVTAPSPSPSPSSSSHSPRPGSHSHSPSQSASATKPGTGTGSGKRTRTSGATGPAGSDPLTGVGASLPPGFTYPPAVGRGGLLGNLPGPTGGPSVPAPSFPEVTPEPSAAASPVTLPGPQKARMANASAQFPLNGRMIGVQVAGLAVLAAAVTIAVARLSLRRRTPQHGK